MGGLATAPHNAARWGAAGHTVRAALAAFPDAPKISRLSLPLRSLLRYSPSVLLPGTLCVAMPHLYDDWMGCDGLQPCLSVRSGAAAAAVAFAIVVLLFELFIERKVFSLTLERTASMSHSAMY